MEDHPYASLFRRAFESSDPGEYADAVADDVEWWEIGSSEPVRGKDALFVRMQEQAGLWQITPEIHDVIANDEHLIALINATAERDGKTLEYRTAEIFHVRDGKVTQRWAFSDDTARIAEFFAT
jgi:ketosteroid isomerase-like protein